MAKLLSNYDKRPFIKVKEGHEECREGWDAVCQVINERIHEISGNKKVVAFECYPGVLDAELIPVLMQNIPGKFYFANDYMLREEEIARLVYPDVSDDEVFGFMTKLQLENFFDQAILKELQKEIESAESGVTCLYGPGAALLYKEADLIVYFDMPRWEIQLRFRSNETGNLGMNNNSLKASLKYKQAFFVDWRVCDRHKKKLMHKWDLIVDTTQRQLPKIVSAATLNTALAQAITQPFRFVPFFDPGPWGGQWLKEHCDLDRSAVNFAWGFDCVPEENSLLFQFNNCLFETPGINLVFAKSKQLLGEPVQARFGDEFPIRFDFLDTMNGGNLSLQVHPTTEYIRENFGMFYTQDESYYMLDAGEDACVYLGLKDKICGKTMIDELKVAHAEGKYFPAAEYVEKWPVKKHDHILIPAGTVHCSGSNSMVLEISATPYIFTFKLWDWGRMGLDGKPRPINIDHGKNVIDWTMTPERTGKELVNAIEKVAEGDGWIEERTGLHEREFIETRRHWFTGPVHHQTNGSVNVLNLVEGQEAIVESPEELFEPFTVHYAETFVIPAHIQEYKIRPSGAGNGKRCATIKAYVRCRL